MNSYKFFYDLAIWAAIIELTLTPLLNHPENWHVFDLITVLLCLILYIIASVMEYIDTK